MSEEKPLEPQNNLIDKFLRRGKKRSAVQVEGIDNIVVHIGKCCQPVPGDEIIGYVTKGKGVTIHRTNCSNIQRLVQVKDRTIEVNWTIESDEQFKVQLSLLGEDRSYLLRDITQALSGQNTNVIHIDLKAKDRLVTGKLIIEVKNLPHLTRVINAISKLKGMLSVERVEGFVRKRIA
jgi:GTP pyrophosphokinase